MSKKRMAGYLRISVDTEEEDRENTSIENQRKIIENYVADRFPGWQLDFFEDRDRSGYTFDQRESYQRLRPQLMSGYYKILIVKDLSRFSRNNGRGLVELEDLRDAKVRIISIGDNIDFPDRDEWDKIKMLFFINEFPVTTTSSRVKNVIANRQNSGKWICSVPYGYRITDPKQMTVEIDPVAAPVVQKIFELYLSGLGYRKIADWLTAQKYPTPRATDKQYREKDGRQTRIRVSSEWSAQSIRGILANDFYIGTLRQHKYARRKINGKDRRLDTEEHRVFESHHEPIIDVRTFAMAQENLKSRSTSHYRGVKKYDTTYSGFLYCGDCGAPMFSMSRPDLPPAYTCGTYHKHGLKGCTSHHTRVDFLDVALKSYVRKIMANSSGMIQKFKKALDEEKKNTGEEEKSIVTLEVELSRAKDKVKRLFNDRNRDIERVENRLEGERLQKEIDKIYETYDEIEDDLTKQIEGLEAQIKLLSDRRNATIQANRIVRTAMDVFKEILEKPHLDKGDLSLIVDRIVVYNDHVDIQLKPDISSLLNTGTVSEELLQQSSFTGENANFRLDTEGIEQMRVIQSVRNRNDKALCVNVICDGDPLEIYTDREGEVIFKKYSPIGELNSFAAQYAETLHRTAELPVAVCDKDGVIACAGIPKKDFLEKNVSEQMEEVMEGRSLRTVSPDEDFPLTKDFKTEHRVSVVMPIVAEGDVIGAVASVSSTEHPIPLSREVETKLIQTAAGFLGKQLES